MLEQVRAQWRFILVGIALVALAAGALAAGVAVLAQGQGDDNSRQVVQAEGATSAGPQGASATEAGGAAGASSGVTQPQSQPTPRPPQGTTYHTVKSGETLGKIAAAYGLTTAAIANANGISNPNLIYVGQRLIIPAR